MVLFFKALPGFQRPFWKSVPVAPLD